MASGQPEINQMETANKKRKLEHRHSIIEVRQVKIKLAGQAQEYVVNLGSLRKHSAFFAKAFDDANGMKEAVQGFIELHDVEIGILESFVYWVHEHAVQLPDGSESITEGNLSEFVELYNFADVHDTRELRNDILKIFCCNMISVAPDYETIGETLHHLRPTSSLYKALLAVAHRELDLTKDDIISDICDFYPADAIKVLIKNFTTKKLKAASAFHYELFAEKAEEDSA